MSNRLLCKKSLQAFVLKAFQGSMLALFSVFALSGNVNGQNYCSSNPNSCQSNTQILNFSLGSTLNFSSPNCENTSGTNGYGDFTNLPAPSENPGDSISYSIDLPPAGVTVYYGIYIDWNDDGDFGDNNEFVDKNIFAGDSFSGNIPIPASAPLSQLRVRVVSTFSFGSNPFGPVNNCPSVNQGEVLDFPLDIICGQPENFQASEAKGDSITLTWSGGNPGGSTYSIEYGQKGFSQGNGTFTSSTSTSKTITGLAPNQSYDFYLREICGPNDSSISVNIKGVCGTYKAVFGEDFENATVPSLPDCWSKFNNTNGAIQSSTNDANNGSKHITIDNSSNTGNNDTLMLITPKLRDLQMDRSVKFFAKLPNVAAENLIIGTLDDPENPSSFNAVNTIGLSSNYQEYSVKFNNTPADHDYIGFRHGTSVKEKIYIDDVTYEFTGCSAPDNLNAISIGGNTVEFDWNSNSGGGEWKVEWGQSGFTPGTGNTAITSNKPYQISGLTASTTYDVYVYEICGPGDTSSRSMVETFTTAACPDLAQATLPYFETFEDVSNFPSGTYKDGASFCGITYSLSQVQNADANWEFNSEKNGRLRFDAGSNNGNRGASLDSDGGCAAKNLVLTLNLSNYSNSDNIKLGFYYKSYGNSASADSVLIRGSSGQSWVGVYELDEAQTSGYDKVTIDIDNALSNAGQGPTATFQVRFKADGCDQISNNGGFTFDDIAVYNCNDQLSYWTGDQGTSYSNPGNWCGNVPASNLESAVIFNNDKNNYPVFSSNITLFGTLIEENAQLDINGNKLTILGDFINQGQADIGNGTLTLTGGADQNVIDTTSVSTVVVNKTGGTANVMGSLEASSNVDLVNGNLNTTNGELRLLADQNGVAYLDDFSSGHNGSITGPITMEQVATGSSGWRYISSPVTNATIGTLQDDFFISTGATGNAYYFDEPSSASDFLDGWIPVSSRSKSMDILQGFDVFFWQASNPNGNVTYPETFDITGTPTTGAQSKSLTSSGSQWNLVGNPYPSAMDWDQVALPNGIYDGIYIWNPNQGQFATYIPAAGGSGTNGADNLIAPMQGFFVYANTGSPTFSVDNSMRIKGTTNFVGKRSKEPKNRISLKANDGEGGKDEMIVYFNDNATESFDGSYDAYEFKSKKEAMPNLYSKIGKENASINGLPEVRDGLVIPVKLESGKEATYTIDASFKNLDPGVEVYLEDKTTGAIHDLQESAVEVEHKPDKTDQFALRFSMDDEATSNEKIAQRSDFSLYSHDEKVVVNFGEAFKGADQAKVKIMTIAGQDVVETQQVPTEGRQEINLGNRAEGVYLVQVGTNEQVKMEKVLVH